MPCFGETGNVRNEVGSGRQWQLGAAAHFSPESRLLAYLDVDRTWVISASGRP